MPRDTFFNLPADKRQRIIDAAVEEFGSHPYARATLDRIVAAAGVSKGSMYQYFEGKADLYTWLLTGHVRQEKLAALSDMAPPAGSSIWEVLEHMCLAGLRFTVARPELTRLAFRFMRERDPDPAIKAVVDAREEAASAFMQDLLEGAQRAGEVRADAHLGVANALLVHALGEGLVHQIARFQGASLDDYLERPELLGELTEGDVRELVRGIINLFRRGVGAIEEDA